MNKLDYLKEELEALGTALRSDGAYFRLIMTDDIDSMAEIRLRAKEGLNHLGQYDKEGGFFHGLCVRQEVQTRLDTLIRKNKPELLQIINAGAVKWKEFGIDVIEDKVQKGYLVILNICGAGFYVSERRHTPRHERRQRTPIQEIVRQAVMAPKEAQQAPGGRKKFTTIRHHVN
ncbi:hypothetical protein D3C87_676150 [compost metagenome]